MRKLSVLLIVAAVICLSHVWAMHLAYEPEEITIELVQQLSLPTEWGCDPGSGPNFPDCTATLGSRIVVNQDAAFVSATSTDYGGWFNRLPGITIFLFGRNEGVWTQDWLFGSSRERPITTASGFSMDGDTAALGISGWTSVSCSSRPPYNCSYRFFPSHVTLLSRTGDEWSSQTNVYGSRSDDSRFGAVVALDGNDLLVSEQLHGDYTSVYIFNRDGGDWVQTAQLYSPAETDLRDGFGSRIAVKRGTALLGAHRDDEQGENAGAVYVYGRSGDGVWTQQAKLLALDGTEGDFFGAAISLDGNTALIGAANHGENDARSGAAYVFTRDDEDNGPWVQQARLLPEDVAQGDSFGTAVSLNGNMALIGAPNDDDNGLNSGSVYLFSRNNGIWTQRVKLLATDGGAGELFGGSVALDGDTALVGAPHPTQTTDRTTPYVFHLVFPPSDLIAVLIDDVTQLDLHSGIENSLISKLNSALMILTDLIEGNDHAAVHNLAAFINQVEAQQGKKIVAVDADDLIFSAQEIIDRLEE